MRSEPSEVRAAGRSPANGGALAIVAGVSFAMVLASGCASVPTLPEWRYLSAEREVRKQERLDHIERARGQAAQIERASFAGEADPNAALPPQRGAERLPLAESVSGPADSCFGACAAGGACAVDPGLASLGTPLDPDAALRIEADRAVAMGDLESAIGLYRELVARSPNDAALRHSLALVAERLDLHDEAAAHYRQAVKLAPSVVLYRMCLEAHADRMRTERPATIVR